MDNAYKCADVGRANEEKCLVERHHLLSSNWRRKGVGRRLRIETLEDRLALAADFGDAPSPYRTTLLENGAWHEAIGPMLGATRDAESDGNSSSAADGDGSDEDGVTFGQLQVGKVLSSATIEISNAPVGARLDAWIDFDSDGNWGGIGEQIGRGVPVANGTNVIFFDIPSWAADGMTFSRFRLSSNGNLGIVGQALDGEVEDHAVFIAPPAATRGIFGEQIIISTLADGARAVFASDLDRDGDVDIISASSRDDKLAWHENNGSQVYTEHAISFAANDPRGIYAVDFDGDKDVDVLVASVNDNTVRWFENDALQQFTEHVISSGEDVPQWVTAADMEGDGDMDVLIASTFDDTVSWFENDGNEGFTKRIVTRSANAVESLQPADMDGDGDMDVLVGAFFDNVLWYENDGNQSFSAHSMSTGRLHVRSVVAADIDGDGDIDAAAASEDDETILWYENNGNRTFTKRIVQTTMQEAQSILAADIDGDGDTDLVAAFDSDNKIVWYENDGSQVFVPHTLTLAAVEARKVFVADVDGDGSLDILSASFNDDKIAWYENLFCNACDDQYSLDEDSQITVEALQGVLTNDALHPAETLTAAVLRMPANGELVLTSDGAFTFRPNPDFFGVDSFTYRVSSDLRGNRDAVVSLMVNPSPDLPQSNHDTYRIEQDSVLNVTNEPLPATLIERNSVWHYLDNGTDPGTAWRDQSFDESTWKSGPAKLGFGDGDEATIVDCGPAAGLECVPGAPNVFNKYITTYFRREFTVDDPSAIAALAIKLRRDDGVVVYLNGVELFRDYMQDGPFNSMTHATDFVSDDGAVFVPFNDLSRDGLVSGVNVIAAEIHQQWPGSSDLSFDLELIAEAFPFPRAVLANDFEPDNNPLTAELLSPTNGILTFRVDGGFDYAPTPGFIGVDSFTYRFSDGESWSEPSTVRIVVSPPGQLQEDLNADGAVNAGDLAFLITSYGKSSAAKAIEGELDGDARIGIRDAIRLRNAFTPAPSPSAPAAIVARASDRALVEAASVNLLRADRRFRRFGDILSETKPAATDQALAAIVETPSSLTGRRSRLSERLRG